MAHKHLIEWSKDVPTGIAVYAISMAHQAKHLANLITFSRNPPPKFNPDLWPKLSAWIANYTHDFNDIIGTFSEFLPNELRDQANILLQPSPLEMPIFYREAVAFLRGINWNKEQQETYLSSAFNSETSLILKDIRSSLSSAEMSVLVENMSRVSNSISNSNFRGNPKLDRLVFYYTVFIRCIVETGYTPKQLVDSCATKIENLSILFSIDSAAKFLPNISSQMHDLRITDPDKYRLLMSLSSTDVPPPTTGRYIKLAQSNQIYCASYFFGGQITKPNILKLYNALAVDLHGLSFDTDIGSLDYSSFNKAFDRASAASKPSRDMIAMLEGAPSPAPLKKYFQALSQMKIQKAMEYWLNPELLKSS